MESKIENDYNTWVNILSSKIIVVLLSFLIVISFSLTAFSGISVTPLLLDFTMDPGSSHSGTLEVQNTGSTPLVVQPQVRGFKTSLKGTAQFLSKEAAKNYPYSGEALLTLKPGEVTLEGGESREFTYELNYPEKPEPFGGRYVGALFQAAPANQENKETKGSSIQVATRVGTLILVRPGEEIVLEDKFQEYSVKPKITQVNARKVYEGRRLLVSTYLKNSGNIHIRKKEFTGMVTVQNSSGETVEEIEISPHNVLPDTEYALTELWKIPDDLKGEKETTYSIKVNISVKTPYGNSVKVEETEKVKI
jgi:hypothetical protein